MEPPKWMFYCDAIASQSYNWLMSLLYETKKKDNFAQFNETEKNKKKTTNQFEDLEISALSERINLGSLSSIVLCYCREVFHIFFLLIVGLCFLVFNSNNRSHWTCGNRNYFFPGEHFVSIEPKKNSIDFTFYNFFYTFFFKNRIRKLEIKKEKTSWKQISAANCIERRTKISTI